MNCSSGQNFRKIISQKRDKVITASLVVERFFAWIGRNRRLAKDFEATIDSARAFPLRRFRHAALTPSRKDRMSFETDSKKMATGREVAVSPVFFKS